MFEIFRKRDKKCTKIKCWQFRLLFLSDEGEAFAYIGDLTRRTCVFPCGRTQRAERMRCSIIKLTLGACAMLRL